MISETATWGLKMLPRSEDAVRGHAELSNSDQSLLERFSAANPQLVPVEWDGRGTFCGQLWHVAFLNHREHMKVEPRCCYDHSLDISVTDHRELWQDRETLDLVHVAHPYCDETEKGFLEGVEILAKRGLNCAMADGSWYYPGRSNLVVVARPRTLERVSFGNLLHFHDKNDEWDTKKIVAMQKAGEQTDAERWFAKAKAEEAHGDYSFATLLFLDAAHAERTGRFHRQAVKCLREAGRLLRDHYDETVINVATRSYLVQTDVRRVFRFAGMEVPVWLEQIWRNRRRPDTWGFRAERNENGTGWIEYYRCVVCEEWMTEGDNTYDANLGNCHSNSECLARLAEVPVAYPIHEETGRRA